MGVSTGSAAAASPRVARCICITDRSLVEGKQQALVVRARLALAPRGARA
jgi:hypothetical protein